MPLSLLFDHFDHLITHPGDLPRLNQAILQLAVQGQLVPQDPTDEPASELLKRIRAEKDRLLLTGLLRRDDPLPPIGEDEIPYGLPEGWVWVRLGEATLINMGQSPPSSAYNDVGDGLPFYQGKKDFGEIYPSPTQWCSAPQKIAEEGDILISVRAPVGPTNICDAKSCIGRGLAAIQPVVGVSNFYLLYTIRAFESNLSGKGVGTTFMAISRKDLEELFIPLPPLAEQKRIVAKVESLLAQTQALAAELAAAEAEQARLYRASLHHLRAASTPADFASRWHFVATHFEAVTPDPASVDELKQAILQLAVQGKLVPQDSADEPASELLRRIEAEKQWLMRESKIAKEKPLSPINEREFLYNLPEGWVWVRVGEIAKALEYGTSEKALSNPRDGVPMLRMGNIGNGRVIYSNLKYISKSIRDLPRLYLKRDDLIFNRTNSYELVGKTAVHKKEDDTFTFASYLIRVSFFLSFLNVDYVNLFFNTRICRETQIEPKITQQTGQANFNGTKLKNIIIPLPPLAEQKLIVAQVERLLGECDELKAALVAGEGARARVVESVLWHGVNGVKGQGQS